MKKVIFTAAGLSLLLVWTILSGCGGGGGTLPASASNTRQVDNLIVPISGVVGNSCNGESVYLQGNYHYVYRLAWNGRTFRLNYHTNLQGVGGTGDTGTKYRLVETDNQPFQINLTKGEVFSIVYRWRLVGQGPNNNEIINSHVQLTVNANGELTVLFDKFEWECR